MNSRELNRTRLFLTGIYFLIIFVIMNVYALVSSSVSLGSLEGIIVPGAGQAVVFGGHRERLPLALSAEARREVDQRLQEARDYVLLTNISLQLILLGLAGIFSYLLAGLTLRPLLKAYKQQREFVMRASHELKTPLTIMKLHSESLVDSQDVAELQEFRQSAQEEVERMQALVNDLLQSVKVNNLARQSDTSANAAEAVLTVSKRQQKQAESKGIEIVLDLPSQGSQVVQFSQPELEEVLTALLDNSIKYSNADGQVRLTVKMTKSKLFISIADQGVGIAAADLEKVFERFYRAEGNDSEGFGLGLTIAREVVESYGGQLVIASELDKGTTVTMTLKRIR